MAEKIKKHLKAIILAIVLFISVLVGITVLPPILNPDIPPTGATGTFYVGGIYDDAYERGDAFFSNTQTIINIRSNIDPSSLSYMCGGFRFINVAIPQGSAILSANVSLYVYSASYDDANIVIYGNDVDDAPDFNDNQNIINSTERPRTSASVSWVADALGTGWKTKTGLKDIIQEIVDRDSWSSDNALALLFIANTDVSKRLYVYSYDQGSEYAAELKISWTPPWMSPSSVHSKCGEHASYPATQAIDGDTDTRWLHYTTCYHWIIFDMGETTPVMKIRLFQSTSSSRHWGLSSGLYVYVSDNPEDFGAAVWEGVLNAAGWQEIGVCGKEGRYVKLVSKSDSLDQTIHEFEVYWRREGNYVVLNSPTAEATETSWSVNFNYTPTFEQTIQNASLHIENTTTVPTSISWDTNYWNTSAVQNNAENTITFDFSSINAFPAYGEGTYKWNVEVFNSTHGVYAISNRTLTIDVPPRYKNVGSSATSIDENESILLYGQEYDGIGVNWAWLWTNETGGSGQNYTRLGSWEQLADRPMGLIYSNLEYYDGKIFSIGGRNKVGIGGDLEGRYDDVYCYFLNNNSWVQKADIPYPQDAAGSGVIDGIIYVAGGYPDGKKHYAYNISSNTWSTKESLPVHRWDCGGLAYQGYLWIIGGSTDGNVQTSLYLYNPENNSWTLKAPMTYGKAKVAVSAYDNKIYAFTSSWAEFHTHVEVYDITTNTWSILSDAPFKCTEATKTAINGKIYLGNDVNKTLWEYDPQTDSYTELYGSNYTTATSGQLTLVEIGIDIYRFPRFTTEDPSDAPFYKYDVPFYNSPMYMNSIADTWIDSNFTWRNTTITSGTTIQWRIYYNDTYGNVNGTGIHSFNVGFHELSVGWNNFTAWQLDVGHTLGQVNASLNSDGIDWSQIVLEYTNGSRYIFVYEWGGDVDVEVTSTDDRFYILVNVQGEWCHNYGGS